jgi:L-threonylcarbamoyladenylate synthase
MDSLGSVVNSLKKGEVIAYPTEGVWGLGCDPSNEKAITKLLNLKGRSKSKGLILIGSSLEQFSKFIEVEKYKDKLLEKWPGHHTWLVPPKPETNKLIIGNNEKIALRLSSHKQVIELCEEFKGAIISSSANKENSPTLGSPEEIKGIFPDIKVLVGELGGLSHPSKIQDLLTGELIRG